MKTSFRLLTAFLLLCAGAVSAQKTAFSLHFKDGLVQSATNLSAARVDSFNNHAIRFKNKTIAVLQFENLPTEALRKELSVNGIELLEYIPQQAYLASITGKLNETLLQQWGVRMITGLAPKQKMHPALAKLQLQKRAAKEAGTVDVQIRFPKKFGLAEVTAALKEKNIMIASPALGRYGVLSLRIASALLEELAALPFVLYVQPEPPKDQSLNFRSRTVSRGAVLNAAVADGGRGLNGEGVVMGIGDDADVQFHADFIGRLINRTSAVAGVHGTHVHGTAAGGGIKNELYRGYAPKATIVSQDFSNILFYTPEYVQDYGMVITNNSYGAVAGCAYMGSYDFASYILDQQAFDYPALQHVFAAGNSGSNTCSPYPPGFHTVLGSYQTAKNVLTVANADYLGNIAASSSRGPVADGRIKPEITAMGEAVRSSVPTNTYGNNSGTSMASPAVAGGLALLYERYRQLNSNANPKSALMKALLCNGATDKGTTGPDYTYGFGFMNLERSITMLENKRYFSGAFTNGATKTHTITVPANTVQLKVMLYWHDPASGFVSSQALVNDLDLKLINPSAVTTYPKILNPAPGGVSNPATEGPDHVNNIEQVVIDNPGAGSYTINIQGSVAENPSQEYFIVYDFIQSGLQVAFPSGGTVFMPGEQAVISWDSYGGPANTFSLEYSTDNGINWNGIETTVNATDRTYNWTVPAQASSQVLVNIKKNGTSLSRTSNLFTILGAPNVSLDATQCEGYINITWNTIAGATDYEVMQLRGNEMVPVAVTAATSFSFNSLSKDSTYWVGVRARIGGKPGRRSVSISRQPNTGTCNGVMSDNDLKLNTLIAPLSGREATSTELGTAAVKVEIKNLDNAAVTGFTIGYRINNSAWVFENVYATVAAGAVYRHTFGTTENFSAVGSYTIVAVVKNNATDVAVANDTLACIIKQLPNSPLDLSVPFSDDFETALAATYQTDTSGLSNAERYDFKPGSFGRLRTFVNSGVAFSGAKALAVDIDRTLSAGPLPVQYLTGTYNLSAYNATIQDLRLQYNSSNGSYTSSPQNKVWIRGADTKPWIEAYTPLSSGASPSIEIGDLLLAQGQNFSSSFQVRWGVPATGQVVSQSITQGLLLDDLGLYEVFNDMQVLGINSPNPLNCGVSGAAPVVLTVRNTSNAPLSNVLVSYSLNTDAWIYETIASIPANTTIKHTFASTVALALPGIYTLRAAVQHAGDTYANNDSLSRTIYNSQTITTFPHLQNFESGNGGWYSDGNNASWQFGTPASSKINSAASGTKAWKTALSGNYNDNEISFLYSPCYTIAGMTKPTISFSAVIDVENCGTAFCDGVWLEYSADGGPWYNLADADNTGTNWYKAPLLAWTVQDYTAWHVATMNLPTGFNTIRFRFVLQSDAAVNREGLAIDDIHIYDNIKGIYTGPTLAAPLTQTVSGNNWVHFESGGKLVASVLPHNQDMGSTAVQAYINTSAVRYTTNQYYHDRNLTIKPTNKNLSAPATIRFYFLDTEMNALANATGCAGCSKPASAYQLGISKFNASNTTTENGTISDNNGGGHWSFITPANVVKVPFDKGYYAEFEVQRFSEFWLNNGSFANDMALPVRLMRFSAKRVREAVALEWTTADEQNVERYQIEVARSNMEFEKSSFTAIGTVKSEGNTTAQRQYRFTDEEAAKSGMRYYRLKVIDADGSFRYSEVRSVVFPGTTPWQVYPNPSRDVFYFVYQAAANESVQADVKDITGKTIKTYLLNPNGFLQKQLVDLTGFPSGAYLLQVRCHGKLQSFKLYKQ
jgi:hypothetical protein